MSVSAFPGDTDGGPSGNGGVGRPSGIGRAGVPNGNGVGPDVNSTIISRIFQIGLERIVLSLFDILMMKRIVHVSQIL